MHKKLNKNTLKKYLILIMLLILTNWLYECMRYMYVLFYVHKFVLTNADDCGAVQKVF